MYKGNLFDPNETDLDESESENSDDLQGQRGARYLAAEKEQFKSRILN